MTSKLWIDIETRSRVDLRKTGVYRYVRCPDWRILMASWSRDGERIRTEFTYEDIAAIPGLWDPRVTKVAHNAAFERINFTEFRYRLTDPDHAEGFLDPAEYHDTQAVAGELGYPQRLSRLGKALSGEQKDEAGTRLINLFCKPRRDGGWNDETTHPLEWLDFIAYCEQDVRTLIDVDRRLGDFPTETERQVYLADQRVNDRGLRLDLDLVGDAREAAYANEIRQKRRVRELSGIDNPGSVQQMRQWLEEQGITLPNLKATTVEALLARPELDSVVREVLELRQELALAAPAKFGSALSSHTDGRLRGSFRFFGAHTGRWAGRGTQPHNLPRLAFLKRDGEKWVHDETGQNAAILDLAMDLPVSSETLKRLVRPMFLIDGVVVDYRSIEAIVLAWLSGEEWVMDAFRAGRDLYVETAERMGGLTRAQGKIAVLALGYQGGPGSLRVMSGDNDYFDPQGRVTSGGGTVAAAAAETSETAKRIKDMDDEELYEAFVYPWRDANAHTARLWKMMDARFRTGGVVGSWLTVEKHGPDRLVRLPSGRAICYRKCGIQHRKWLNPRTNKIEEREYVTFLSPIGKRVDTYGGRLVENATQAVARDILAEALVRLDQRGFRVVGHVHDEILVEGTDALDEVARIMAEPPSWAVGLPIDGEGFTTTRYRKG